MPSPAAALASFVAIFSIPGFAIGPRIGGQPDAAKATPDAPASPSAADRVTRPMSSAGRRSARWLAGAAAIAGAQLIALVASASAGQEQQGAQILRELDTGGLHCGQAGTTDFERVGEYVMSRMVGSAGGHEAMDRLMSMMMGAGNEERVHEAMGRRFAGCGGGRLPGGFGRMMGAVNAMGMMGGGMMGAAAGRGEYGPGSMMGGYRSDSSSSNDNDGPSAGAMLGVMAVLIVGVALALWWFAGRRRPADPLETLRRRYARGELNADEYAERKRLLQGGGRA